MIEFIVIVESDADARTSTQLAERILIEKVEWLENDSIQYCFQWSGLQAGTKYSCWSDVLKIIDEAKKQLRFKPSRYLGHERNSEPLKADGASSIKLLNLVRFLQKTRPIQAVILIRDLDNQPERRQGLEQARLKHIDGEPAIEDRL